MRGEAPTRPSEATRTMGRSIQREIELATQRTYRKFTAKQKLEIVLAGLRGDRSVKDVCREHEIAETLYYSCRDKLIEGGVTLCVACRQATTAARSCVSLRLMWIYRGRWDQDRLDREPN
jgi:transposase